MDDYYVCIVEDATRTPDKVMGPMTASRAGRIARGASFNLNHDEWSVITYSEDELPEGWKEKAR
jgi:hypothetical protein